MNKLAYIVASSALVVSALAQGSVNVNNRSLAGSPVVRNAPTINLGAALIGTNFVAQIVYGASAGSLSTALGDVMPFRVASTTSPGTWNPGAAGVRTLTGFAEGATVSMQVNVWDSTVFSSWSAASAALAAGNNVVATQAGSSSVFTYTVGAAANPASLTINNFQGFSLTAIPAVPEPTTIALGALGAAALLWRRRK
jgi:hypothetical protein